MAGVSVLREETFLDQVEKVRYEVKNKFSKARLVLQERELSLLSELQELVAIYRGDEIEEEIHQLYISKEQIMATRRDYGDQENLKQSLPLMDARIRELENCVESAKNSLRSVVLDWDQELEGRLSDIGGIRLYGLVEYKNKSEPVLLAGKHSPYKSTTPGVFAYPHSITIDPQTKNVYICDGGNNRVQVFTNTFEFLFQFDEKMDSPCGLSIFHDKIYVTQYQCDTVNVYAAQGNLLQSVGGRGDRELEFDRPMGITVSDKKNIIYVCDNFNDRMQCLNLDLTFNGFIPYICGPRDIQLTQEAILILKAGYQCISIFNYAHHFIREIIRCGHGSQLINPLFFCLDPQNNIILSDWSVHCVAIFSGRGHMIHKFGRQGDGRGEFIRPRGIALDSENRILVASYNPNYPIQLF